MEYYQEILEAEEAWKTYCKENNIRNPLNDNDRNAYNFYKEQEDIWIGQYLLENYGCNELIFFTKCIQVDNQVRHRYSHNGFQNSI